MQTDPRRTRAQPSSGTVIHPGCISPGISLRSIARYLGTETRKIRLLARDMGLRKERFSRAESRALLYAYRVKQGVRIARQKPKP
jgi:hypothetical protein